METGEKGAGLAEEFKMRSFWDRVRYVTLYEFLGFAIVIPIGALVTGSGMLQMGGLSITMATIATLWNMAFNYLYDIGAMRMYGTTHKTQRMRLAHTLMFQLGLLAFEIPAVMLFLGTDLVPSIIIGSSMTGFYMVYNYFFAWGYDVVFPLPEVEPEPAPA